MRDKKWGEGKLERKKLHQLGGENLFPPALNALKISDEKQKKYLR